MTPVEELLESTLTDAATRMSSPTGLADHSRQRAGQIKARRRVTALSSAGAAVLVVVGALAVVSGRDDRASAPAATHVASSPSTVSESPSPTASSSGSQAPEPTSRVLQDVGVLAANGTTIYDGARTVKISPRPHGAAGIRAISRVPGHGYAVIISDAKENGVALVSSSGSMRYLVGVPATASTQGPTDLAVSSDGTTIAYGMYAGTSTQISLVDPSGQLIARRDVPGRYRPTAVDASQVWLRTEADGTTLPPIVWNRKHGTTTTLQLGDMTDVTAVDLERGYAAITSGQCGLMLVKVSAPTSIVTRRCHQEAVSFSRDGWLLASEVGRLTRLTIPDLTTVWMAYGTQNFAGTRGWAPDGQWVGVDPDGQILVLEPSRGSVTITIGTEINDASLVVAEYS
jgi:hypothetical protein